MDKNSNKIADDAGERKKSSSEPTHVSPVREALPQISAVCVKNVLLTTWGLTLGFPTILIPSLSGDDPNERIILGQEAISWIGSINLICVPIGSLVSGTITQALGRKRAMQLVNIPFMISWMIFHFSNQVWMIFLALCLSGLSGGLLEAPVLTYVAEITQPHLRGILSATASIAVTVGYLIQLLLGTFLDWRSVALVSCCFPIASFILLMFVPETPIWLISKNRLEEAKKSIAWLRGWVRVEEIEDEYQELYKQLTSTDSTSDKPVTFAAKMRLFKNRSFLWPYMLVAFAFFLCHFNGITTLSVYAIKIFDELRAPINKYYCTLLMSVVQLLGCIVCMVLINILGKRVLNFVSLIGSAICFIVVAVHAYLHKILYFKNSFSHSHVASNSSINGTITGVEELPVHWVPVIFLVLAAFLTYIGIRNLPWILTGEVYPTEIRAFASGLSGGTGYVLNFISNKIFLTLVSFLTLPGIFFVYGVVGAFGFVVLYFLLPETEGKTLYEVTEHFAGRTKLRNSVGRKKRVLNGTCNPAFVNDNKTMNDTKF